MDGATGGFSGRDAMQPRLIVYGDLAMDIVVSADSFPLPGQDVIVDHLTLRPGGVALNSTWPVNK